PTTPACYPRKSTSTQAPYSATSRKRSPTSPCSMPRWRSKKPARKAKPNPAPPRLRVKRIERESPQRVKRPKHNPINHMRKQQHERRLEAVVRGEESGWLQQSRRLRAAKIRDHPRV